MVHENDTIRQLDLWPLALKSWYRTKTTAKKVCDYGTTEQKNEPPPVHTLGGWNLTVIPLSSVTYV